MVMGVRKTPEREKLLYFGREAVLIQETVIFVRAGSGVTFKGNLEALANVSLGTVNQASYGPVFDAALQRGDFHHIDQAPGFETNFRELLAGRIDAVVNSRATGLGTIHQIGADNEIRVSGPPIEWLESFLAFNRDTRGRALAAAFDRVVADEKKRGTFVGLVRRP